MDTKQTRPRLLLTSLPPKAHSLVQAHIEGRSQGEPRRPDPQRAEGQVGFRFHQIVDRYLPMDQGAFDYDERPGFIDYRKPEISGGHTTLKAEYAALRGEEPETALEGQFLFERPQGYSFVRVTPQEADIVELRKHGLDYQVVGSLHYNKQDNTASFETGSLGDLGYPT